MPPSRAASAAPEVALPEGCAPVLEGAAGLSSHSELRRSLLMQSAEESIGIPVVLRQAAARPAEPPFTVEAIRDAVGHLRLPRRTVPDSGFGGLFIGNQGGGAVMESDPPGWNPKGMTFGDFIGEKVLRASPLYMRLCSGKNACQRSMKSSDKLAYAPPDDPEVRDLVCALLERVPIPRVLPFSKNFSVVTWLGSEGGNFGLHSDFFAEQYLLQHEGWKEVFLLLPEDAEMVQPMGIETGKPYKSAWRSVEAMTAEERRAAGCLWVLLAPGDLLFLPEFWWHEVRIVSKGPSLTTTFRHYLPEDKTLFAAIRSLRALHESFDEEEEEPWSAGQSAALLGLLQENVMEDVLAEREEEARRAEAAVRGLEVSASSSSSAGAAPAEEGEESAAAPPA